MKIVDETSRKPAAQYKDLEAMDVFTFEGGDGAPRVRSMYGYMNLVSGDHVKTDTSGTIRFRKVILMDAVLTIKEK